MSKLYDIVNKTINAGSMLEAEQILFGSDGIVINSKEYYENIISNFVRKKETVIRKIVDSNGKIQLVFDLNNCNDMWNILFIYNYYINYLDNRITDLNQQINDCNRVKDALLFQKLELNQDDPRYNEIFKQYQDKETERKNIDKLKSYFIQLKNNSLSVNDVQLENIERIDEIQLKQYLDKLKEAINCIQKIRDSLEHRNSNFNFDNNILNINNKLGKFEILIPIEYLDGFNKGRIIANEEDQIVVQRTNEIALPLLNALDYDIKKINSFFYNVEPSYLELILEKVNYDANELYKLSSYIFEFKNITKIFLNKGFDLFDISKLPEAAFMYIDNTIKLKKEGIDISKLPEAAFEYVDNTIKLKKEGFDISKLPEAAFKYADNTIKLKKEGIDISKLPYSAFRYADNIIKLKKEGFDISKLPYSAFRRVDNTIKLKKEGIDISKLPYDAFWYVDNTIKIVDKVGYELLEMIPVEFFICDIALLDEMFKKYNLNISRSIFGIKNPKIIAALVYANSVLSNYNDKTISTIDMDIKPYSIICDTYIDNYKYINNIEENIGREYNSLEFVEQFKLFDEDNFDRSTVDIKKIILNKFRNACAHFRFKLVKGKDGNIIEDKVYIYDEDNNGINNFNLIIDLNEFISIVREAEIHIGMQKNNIEESIKKLR